jgi:heavy metal sensor kinase
MRFFKTLKFRLTIWQIMVSLLMFLIFGTLAYLTLSRELNQNLDDSLEARAEELQSTLTQEGTQFSFAQRLSEVVLIYDSNSVLLQDLGPHVQFAGIDGLVKKALLGQSSYLTASTEDGQYVRLYASPLTLDPKTRIVIVVGRTPSEISDVLDTFRSVLIFSAIGAILIVAVGGFFWANRTLLPMRLIVGMVQQVGEKNLSRRLEVQSEDELGRLAGTLNRMMERLEDAFDRQRQFTADASHELRAPLAVIQAESTLALEKERTGPEYRKSLETVSLEVFHMSKIIERLLFLARWDAGKEPLNLQNVDMKELLTEVSSDIDVLALEKGLKFSLGPVSDITMKGDRVKLRQLIINLLGNAIRYTPCGGSVSASLVQKRANIVLAVVDTGIGIAPEHLPLIFERFYRVDKARSRAEGGVGLGLAISKSIAEAHGGKIEVESQEGRGSTFRVIFPALHPEPQVKPEECLEPAPAKDGKFKQMLNSFLC